MSEKGVIARSPRPFPRAVLAQQLRALGVEPGMVLLVHASLSQIGYVPGGPVTVIQALQEVLTADGTLVMPAHTSDYSDPAAWQHPSVPSAWVPIVRESMPAFDPARTPTRQMGAIAELFRTWPAVRRSHHPQVSFAAWGKQAQRITADHGLDFGLGERSPLARIYDLDGRVLLLGVGYDRNTSFHLGEVRAECREVVTCGAPMLVNGRRVWQTYRDIDYDEDEFPQIGAALERQGAVTVGTIGLAECRLFLQRTAVDFATRRLGRGADAVDINSGI